jgi:hypothetical protein
VNPTDVPPPEPRDVGSVKWWNDHWILQSSAHYGSSGSDESGYNCIVKEPVTDAMLGQSVREMLNASRMLKLEEARAYFSREISGPRYERWIDWCIRSLGARDRKALFKGLKLCNIDRRLGVVEIRPQRRTGSEGWVGLGDPDALVKVSETVSDSELGAALRLAMSRAIGKTR